MIKNSIFILLIVLIMMTAGCSIRLTDFTVMSSKNINLSQLHTFERSKDRVEGQDTKVVLITLIPTFQQPTWKEAVDNAIEKIPGAVGLVDGVVYVENFWFIIGTASYVVKGTPLIDPKLVSTKQTESNYLVGYIDPISK